MYFQDILQGIASILMDSNLFQLKSSTFCVTCRWVLITGGFLLTYFQASVGLVFWEYQTGSLIWVIGHLAAGYQTIKMPKAKYVLLNILLAEARVKAVFLQTQMQQKGAHVKQVNFSKFLTNCVKFWPIFNIKNIWKNGWPKKEDSLHSSLPQINKTWTTPQPQGPF